MVYIINNYFMNFMDRDVFYKYNYVLTCVHLNTYEYTICKVTHKSGNEEVNKPIGIVSVMREVDGWVREVIRIG